MINFLNVRVHGHSMQPNINQTKRNETKQRQCDVAIQFESNYITAMFQCKNVYTN